MIGAPSPFPDVEAMEPERAAVRELAAHIYSAQAELALKVARLDDDGGGDQEVWVELAQTISGSQLIRICLGTGGCSAATASMAVITTAASSAGSGAVSGVPAKPASWGGSAAPCRPLL